MELEIKNIEMPIVQTEVDIAPEFKVLSETIYSKISTMIRTGHLLDVKNDPNTIRLLIGTSMLIVQNYRTKDNQGLRGPEKKTLALTLIKLVIESLAKSGKIEKETATLLIMDIDLWGGVAMDVAVDTGKVIFNVGQGVAKDAQNFGEDAKTVGCKQSCAKNCCCCLM